MNLTLECQRIKERKEAEAYLKKQQEDNDAYKKSLDDLGIARLGWDNDKTNES